jgi:uncharacterized cupin superfamily protein
MPTSLPSLKSLLLSLLFAPAVLAAGQVESVPYAPPAESRVLGTTFVDWDSLIAEPTPFGELRAVFDNPTPTLEKFEVHVTTLRPGMLSNAVHRHPWEEIVLVKDGNLEVSINGGTQHVGPGYLIFFASNDAHSLRNWGDKDASYYDINFYTDLVHTVADKPAAEQAVPGKLASSVIDCNGMKVSSTKTGSRVSVAGSATITFLAFESHITTLNAGQSTAADIVDSGDEFVVLKSGSVEVTVNGVAARIEAGSMVYWAPNDRRTLRNVGATPAAYQVIRVVSDKSPKQAGG